MDTVTRCGPLPICSKSRVAIAASNDIETTSPIDAAKGVARLSGFIVVLLEIKITATSTKSIAMGGEHMCANSYY